MSSNYMAEHNHPPLLYCRPHHIHKIEKKPDFLFLFLGWLSLTFGEVDGTVWASTISKSRYVLRREIGKFSSLYFR
jgi:hypothetical protein